MNFGEAVVSGFRNYIDFSGRASWSEYWFFMLFVGLLVGIVIRIAEFFLFYAYEGLAAVQLATNLVFLCQ